MAKDPAFPFYAQDFLTGVMHLDMTERGIYITLLAYQWAHNSIPKKRVGFILGLGWDSLSQEVKNKFEDHGETLVNRRLEDERDRRAAFKLKQSENGKKGGRPSKSKKPNDNQTKSQKKPLEDEHEQEHESKGEREQEIVYPFDHKDFLKMWETWKLYKKQEFGFKYKSPVTEQAALTKLSNLADGDYERANGVLLQSMENGWKGFFEITKPKGNGKQTDSDWQTTAYKIAKKRGLV